MNCCGNSGTDSRMPVMQPGLCRPVCGQPDAGTSGSCVKPSESWNPDRFPVGMGYVPMQCWQEPYPLAVGFSRGTLFSDLDYPFMRARCRA